MTEQLDKNASMSELAAKKVSRRNILKLSAFAGAGAVASTGVAKALAGESAPVAQTQTSEIAGQLGFTPISASTADELVLPPGFSYNIVRSWGDYVTGGETFGFNNDYIAYFPIDYLEGGNSSEEGLLWVNHEYNNPLFVSGRAANANPTFDQLIAEKSNVGGSIIHIKRDASGNWNFVDDPAHNRRVTAWTLIDLDGPAAGSPAVFGATEVQGTLANCAGGITPWGTALTAEENFQDYGPDVSKGGSGWAKSETDDRFFTEEHYGWIVEIDPFDKSSKPVKHTALGRFRHEGATVTIAKSGKVVVYMGYDRADYPIYKFISDGVYNPADRAGAKKLLSSGKLYTADFSAGKWIEVTVDNPKIADKYKTQADVLVNAGEAAILAGATKCDRAEDIEINPADNTIFVAFTNNSGHGNFYGHITRLTETGGDFESLTFSWEIFAQGGPQVGSNFGSPDNLIFDPNGNLYICCDVSSSVAGKGIYKTFGNNGVYVIPTVGPNAGNAYQFASGPVECETTGPFWSPDHKTLFLSIQHPGEETPSMDKLTSHWPGGGDSMPKPSVVAIKGFKF